MPKAFDRCVKEGGRVRTRKLRGNRFMRICFDRNGKSHTGEVKTRKAPAKDSAVEKVARQIVKESE